MKIGIVTIIDYRNYGNRLQNYAVQKILEKKNIETETILNDFYKDSKYENKSILNNLIHCLKVMIWNVWSVFTKNPHELSYVKKSDKLLKERIYNNIAFSEKYINETGYLVRGGITYKHKMNTFDFLVVGSDQVWNPKMNFGSGFFFLQNIPEEKRIAFSASCGLDRIPEKYEEQWIKYLNGMRHISVRETSAANYIKSVCEKDVEVLLDPTMLVDRKVWDEMILSNSEKRKSYLLTYILGDDESNTFIREVASKKGLQLIQLNDRTASDLFTVGADKFVSLIANAEMIITDSFHACVFSILYEKEFFVIHRKGDIDDIFSRVDNLLNIFDLQDRVIDSMSIDKLIAKPLSHENIENVLIREKNKAEKFLEKALFE